MEQVGRMEVSVFRGGEEVSLLPMRMTERDFFFAAGRHIQAESISYTIDAIRHLFARMETPEILKDQYSVVITPGRDLQETLVSASDYEEVMDRITFSLGLFKGEPHLINQGDVMTPIPLGKTDRSSKLESVSLVERAAFTAVLDNLFDSVTLEDILGIMYAVDPFLRREEWKTSQDIREWIRKEESRRNGSAWRFMMQFVIMDDVPHQIVRLSGEKPLPWNK